jgi:hypothetical protein
MPPRPDLVIPELPHRSDTPAQSESAQLAFFDGAMERSARAEARLGVVVRHLEVAGTRVGLHFAGDRLLSVLFPALSHLEIPPNEPADVTFHLWDTLSSGVDPPPPPCRRECFTERGDIWGMSSRRVRSAFHWIEFSLNLLDLERRTGMFWVRSAEGLPYWTAASPLRSLLHWWMEANGHQLLHAAAVEARCSSRAREGQGNRPRRWRVSEPG